MNGTIDHDEATRPRRLLKPGCSAFSLALAIGCGAWLWWASHRGYTAARFERSIRLEVPPRCNRQAVEAWFDRHRLQHSWSDDTRVAGVGDKTVAELAGLRDAELSGVCWTVITGPEVNVSLVFHGEIGIYFFFDGQGHCMGHYVDEFALVL